MIIIKILNKIFKCKISKLTIKNNINIMKKKKLLK